MIIAIDGPAGAGKSTLARRLGRELGFAFLDTGAMYRAVAAEALRRGVDVEDAAGLATLAGELQLAFDAGGQIVIDGRPADAEIRRPAVDEVVSAVSAHPEVRAAIVPKQKAFARGREGVVAEGRDMTTVVFPEAELRVYLDASAGERARRRARQRGRPELEAEYRAAIEERDRLDSTRASSPLRHAAGVLRLDTDSLTEDEVLVRLLELAREAQGR